MKKTETSPFQQYPGKENTDAFVLSRLKENQSRSKEIVDERKEDNVQMDDFKIIFDNLEIKYNDVEFQQPIGNGTFATVLRGRWKQRDVAIKRSKIDYHGRPIELSFIENEAKLLAAVDHPNIVKLHGWVSEPGCLPVRKMPWGMAGKLQGYNPYLMSAGDVEAARHYLVNEFIPADRTKAIFNAKVFILDRDKKIHCLTVIDGEIAANLTEVAADSPVGSLENDIINLFNDTYSYGWLSVPHYSLVLEYVQQDLFSVIKGYEPYLICAGNVEAARQYLVNRFIPRDKSEAFYLNAEVFVIDKDRKIHCLTVNQGEIETGAMEITVDTSVGSPDDVIINLARGIKWLSGRVQYLTADKMAFLASHTDYEPRENEQSLNVVSAAYDTACALLYLHSHGITHGDIKIENILIDGNGRAKLCDLGFACQVNASGIGYAPKLQGTPNYMAPELFQNNRYSCQSDMYAFGVVLWEMVTHRSFFAEMFERHPGAAIKMILEGKREAIPADCDPDIAALITECWRPEPARRPTAEEVASRLSCKLFAPLSPRTDCRQTHGAAGSDDQRDAAFVRFLSA